jgi:hypothetical protein
MSLWRQTGERRYEKIFFQIYHEVIRTGGKGRPPKVLREGLKVRLKKAASAGRKIAPNVRRQPEQPQTAHKIQNHDIHANHVRVEACNTSLQRTNSAFRRRCNTYAKNTNNLQRTLTC